MSTILSPRIFVRYLFGHRFLIVSVSFLVAIYVYDLNYIRVPYRFLHYHNFHTHLIYEKMQMYVASAICNMQ